MFYVYCTIPVCTRQSDLPVFRIFARPFSSSHAHSARLFTRAQRRNASAASSRWSPRTDGLGCGNNSLCERAGQIVRYLDCFRGSNSHTLSVCLCERRASPKVTHLVGSVMTKSLGQAFSKACRSRTASWSPSAEGEISLCKQRSGEHEKPIKGVSLWEGGSMPPSHT